MRASSDIHRLFQSAWHRRGSHGFVAAFRSGEGIRDLSVFRDQFSTAQCSGDGVEVVVQAGMRSSLSARELLGAYLANPDRFRPPRNTEGSFLIIDAPHGRAVAGRDRAQAFHLYSTRHGGSWIFGSNLLPLLDALPLHLDAVACDFYLRGALVLAPLPLVAQVRCLRPGHWVTVDGVNGPGEEKVFWQIERVDTPHDYDTAIEQYGELLLRNIKAHLGEDAVAGAFLSGGSDSAAVVGALHRLGVDDVVAAHMECGNFATETRAVETLRRGYGFRLLEVKPPPHDAAWACEVARAVTSNQPGSYLSYPLYARAGQELAAALGRRATVFNGELCLLDVGFSDSSDGLRGLRRWLYSGHGRSLATLGPLLPVTCEPDWSRIRRPSLDRHRRADQAIAIGTAVRSFLHAIGRPARYFGGLKLGFAGLPGFFFLTSYLPKDYSVDLGALFEERFFNTYADRLMGDEWRQAFLTATTCWYAEASNFTMPLDAAAAGGNPACFPFSSVELMDFAASIPVAWTVDKKIQKDMCARLLGMPAEVAYGMKDHRSSLRYADAAYGAVWPIMQDLVRQTDYGPLQSGVASFISGGRDNDARWFSLYALARLMDEYKLAIN